LALTPFESDISGEPEALRRLASSPPPAGLDGIDLDDFERIVFSGMGSSHVAAHPTWRRLVAAGRPAWWLSAPLVLDRPEILDAGTLLVLTSQSGRSGEIVALLERLPHAGGRRLIAVTNDALSPLAEAADVVVELHAGDEATVSTKSYANTLAALARLTDALEGRDGGARAESVLAAADALESLAPGLDGFAMALAAERQPRVVLVADGARTASALFGGLIIKEAAKLPAEGFVGGEFRHGPFELAGPGLGAVLFRDVPADPSLERLAADLFATGSRVLSIGLPGAESPAGQWVTTAATDELGRLVCDAAVAQHLSVALARANGVVPGEFRFGAKVTTIL
jgi:fructoselysine-6-P-deglycase FrlB-like protein